MPGEQECPVEETGMNSVKPSRNPSRIASKEALLAHPALPSPKSARICAALSTFALHVPLQLRHGDNPFHPPANGMIKLYHHPLSAQSRFVRLILGECEVTPELVEERVWERRTEFLMLNPAGTLPVLVEQDGPPISGAWAISEYLDETRGFGLAERRLLPANSDQRAEVRRLMEWFLFKFDDEVTTYLVEEKVIKRERGKAGGNGGAPEFLAAPGGARQHPHASALYRASDRRRRTGWRATG